MVRARTAVATVVVAAMLVSTGCLGLITGSGETFNAKPAIAAEDTASSANYEYRGTQKLEIERTFEAADQQRNVTAINYLSVYEKTLSIPGVGEQKAGVVAVLSTPQVKILGQNFNPVGDWSERKLAKQLQSRYDSISIGDRVGNTTVTSLGKETDVAKFEGTASLDGNEVDIYVHVTKFKHEGDYVVALAVYPQMLDGEEENVLSLIRNIEHPSDPPITTQSKLHAAVVEQ